MVAGSTPVEEVETISDGEEENGREGGKRYSQRGEGGRSRLWAMQSGFGGDGAAGRKSPGGGGEGTPGEAVEIVFITPKGVGEAPQRWKKSGQ